MQTSKKGFGAIGIIFIIAALAVLAGGYLVYQYVAPTEPSDAPSPTPESRDTSAPAQADTTGWQTYRNEQYGFSLVYPETWRVAAASRDPNIRAQEVFGFEVSGISIYDRFAVTVYPKQQIKDVQTWVRRFTLLEGGLLKTAPEWSSNFRADAASVEYSQADAGGISSYTVWAEQGDHIFTINGILTQQNLQILSTFKFIE